MNTRQDVMDDRLVALEEKLSLLQETLESLPEALSRFLSVQQLVQPPASLSNESEQQRRQQFLHPETSYGSGAQAITHSRSVPNAALAPATAAAQSGPSSSSAPVYQQQSCAAKPLKPS